MLQEFREFRRRKGQTTEKAQIKYDASGQFFITKDLREEGKMGMSKVMPLEKP